MTRSFRNILCGLAALVLVVLQVAWSYRDLPMQECAWCHRERKLNRHHLIPQATAPELRDVQTNLVVLCRDCHFVLGHRCSWRKGNPDLQAVLTYTNWYVNQKEQ